METLLRQKVCKCTNYLYHHKKYDDCYFAAACISVWLKQSPAVRYICYKSQKVFIKGCRIPSGLGLMSHLHYRTHIELVLEQYRKGNRNYQRITGKGKPDVRPIV